MQFQIRKRFVKEWQVHYFCSW